MPSCVKSYLLPPLWSILDTMYSNRMIERLKWAEEAPVDLRDCRVHDRAGSMSTYFNQPGSTSYSVSSVSVVDNRHVRVST